MILRVRNLVHLLGAGLALPVRIIVSSRRLNLQGLCDSDLRVNKVDELAAPGRNGLGNHLPRPGWLRLLIPH